MSRAISEGGAAPDADARFEGAVDKLLDGLVR
ncbi:hypothetical protein FHX42_000142 [Saccharopolyspora lacisalsi]|uniref:Uncharacterized protein n=1 Tax=Halosaccharopolyspora lacisalsi TaxID=1000566 RepID=A0A839DP30_9PSEU|nr:hypothetical protein [Halosaccharopolyspora lacisalsi]